MAGRVAALTDAGFTNGCSCRLHGQSSIVPDGLNLALHVGDDVELVLANRGLYAAALRVRPWTALLPAPRCMALKW